MAADTDNDDDNLTFVPQSFVINVTPPLQTHNGELWPFRFRRFRRFC
jgi:hypothetical protein